MCVLSPATIFKINALDVFFKNCLKSSVSHWVKLFHIVSLEQSLRVWLIAVMGLLDGINSMIADYRYIGIQYKRPFRTTERWIYMCIARDYIVAPQII